MPKLVCTYCSGPKRNDGGLMPAVERYRSERIIRLCEEALAAGAEFRILSGEFGLLEPDYPIPWYDHLLQPEEVTALVGATAGHLAHLAPERVEYHTADPEAVPAVAPYARVMEKACRLAQVPLEIYILDGNPD